MEPYKYVLRHVVRPFLLKYIKRWPKRRVFEKTFRGRLTCTIDENRQMQRQRLHDLLVYAVCNVPYYKKIAKERNISIQLDTVEQSLLEFPILTKDIIRSEFEALKSSLPRDGIYINSSGGSTGVPVQFVQDKQYREEEATLILDGFSGYEFGDKIVQLWGSERDIIQGSAGLKNKLMNTFFYRKLTFNTFRMSQKDMLEFVEKINQYKPKYMLAYVQSAYELACYIEQNALNLHRMDGIIVSAGTLYIDFREKIEKVFGCPVFNRYGSREVGNMAMECEAHQGLHINIINQYLEFIGDSGQHVMPNETGRILVTSLNNYAMPLIRYEIGDMGVPCVDVCSCGRGLPLVKNITGRSVNVFRTRDGVLVDGEYFTHLFYGLDFIRQFQVLQEDYERVIVKYALSEPVSPDSMDAVKSDIRHKIGLVMGASCTVNFEELDEILPSDSGKYVYTISKIKP